MSSKHPQQRVDPADGRAYPLDSFLEFYGEDEGQRRWATAGQQPAYPGVSLLRACVMPLCVLQLIFVEQPVPLALSLCLTVSLGPVFRPVTEPSSSPCLLLPCLHCCHCTLLLLLCVRVERFM